MSTDAEQLLPTILSQVQLVKVPPHPADVLGGAAGARFPTWARPRPWPSHPLAGDLLEPWTMAEKGEDELFLLFRDWLRACSRPQRWTVSQRELPRSSRRWAAKAKVADALRAVPDPPVRAAVAGKCPLVVVSWGRSRSSWRASAPW